MLLEIMAVSVVLLLCGGLAGYLYHERVAREHSGEAVDFGAVREYVSRKYGIRLSEADREQVVNAGTTAKARVDAPKMLGRPKDG